MLVARLSNLKTPVYSTALFLLILLAVGCSAGAVSYTHLRAHETPEHLVCRLMLEKKTINK